MSTKDILDHIFSFIINILFTIWTISVVLYMGDMYCWFFDTEGGPIQCLACIVAAGALLVPCSLITECILLFYYLAFVQDWNIWLAILYIIPGLLLAWALPIFE